MKRILSMILTIVLLVSVSAARAEKEEGETYRIENRKKPPALITERKLTNEEIEELGTSGLDILKEKIQTYGDYIAWVRIALAGRVFLGKTSSDGENQFTFGARFSFPWLESFYSPIMTVSIAHYVLADDYPGIGTVCVFLKNGNQLDMKCANYLPADAGYYVVNAEQFIGMDTKNLQRSCALNDLLFVSDLSGIPAYFNSGKNAVPVVQILAWDTVDTIILNQEGWRYTAADMRHVVSVYYDESVKYPPEDSLPDFRGCGFPKQLSTESSIDAETAKKLEKGTYEEAVTAIKTIPDALSYLYYTGFSPSGPDERVDMHDGEWHFNLKPEVVFRLRRGSCGCISGLIAALLEGDYEEVGMITLRSPADGHVINYVRDGDLYYVFDAMSWSVGGYQKGSLCFFSAKTLEEAALKYGKIANTRQMFAYINPRGGDCPVVFEGCATKIPSHYCDLTILQETPDEGYVYIPVDEDPAAMEAIDVIRSVW